MEGSLLLPQFMVEIQDYDLIVIGGGAAGLMAAGVAAREGKRVALLEKMEKTGRKVRISGKGRGNITNARPAEEFASKIRSGAEFFQPAFAELNNHRTIRFFERIGVRMVIEQGNRVFPKSGKAWDVAQALVDWCRDKGVEVICDCRVEHITVLGGKVRGVQFRNARGFIRKIEAPAVVLATGGASYPATGSTGDGYELAHRLGHTIVPVRPALVPLVTSHPEARFMSGLLLRNIGARLLVDGEVVQEEFGEFSFSPHRIDGAVVLRMSRRAVDALIDEKEVRIRLDLKPALDEATITARLEREMAEAEEELTIGELLRKVLPRELVVPVAKSAGLIAKHSSRELQGEKMERVVAALKCFELPITDYRPFEEAIVTAGGVSLDEIWPDTMESKLVSGLYFAGEVMDIDADTGGYNLQMAFSTGYLAGQLRRHTN